jgi:hypothetical protein
MVYAAGMGMQVAFHKVDGGRLCGWTAQIPRHRPFQGTTMASGRNLPHDLAQFVVESVLGLPYGFWGLLASGATFESVRRRPTQPGRRVISTHRAALMATEHAVNTHVAAWRANAPTPAGPALEAMLTRWRALPVGEELRVEWPARRERSLSPGRGRGWAVANARH